MSFIRKNLQLTLGIVILFLIGLPAAIFLSQNQAENRSRAASICAQTSGDLEIDNCQINGSVGGNLKGSNNTITVDVGGRVIGNFNNIGNNAGGIVGNNNIIGNNVFRNIEGDSNTVKNNVYGCITGDNNHVTNNVLGSVTGTGNTARQVVNQPCPSEPTQQPPTQSPPTQQPPTQSPPTQQPPTQSPPTQQPPTQQPPTQSPPTQQPPTQVPVTALSLTVFMHGIGNSGDNANPTAHSLSNKNPLRPTRLARVTIYDLNNQLISTSSAELKYSSASGNFTGRVVTQNTLSPGSYNVRVLTDQHLVRLVPGIQTLNPQQDNPLPEISLVTGDIINDNKLNILDYNQILDCYSDNFPAPSCSDLNKKQQSDINDDGPVNGYDYNLLLRELSVQSGD